MIRMRIVDKLTDSHYSGKKDTWHDSKKT